MAEAQKLRTRAIILDSAARLLRSRGIEPSSVADVMAGAGLTVGGFYAHFRSKDQLFDCAFDQVAAERAESLHAAGGTPGERLTNLLGSYLARGHRDEPATGCPLPSSVTDVGRGSARLRRSLARVVERLLGALGNGSLGAKDRQRALATLALSYGGLSLARAVRGSPLSDEILAACRAFGATALAASPAAPRLERAGAGERDERKRGARMENA